MGTPGRERLLDIEQLAVTIEIMQDAVLVYDDQARIVLVNDRLLAATGYTRAEIIGQHALILVPEGVREALAPRMAAYIDSPVPRALGDGLDGAIVRKDGTTFEAQLANAPVSSTRGRLVVVTIRDVKDLSLHEIRFRGLLESAPDATVIVSPEGRVVLSNSRASRLFGRERLELFGRPIVTLFPEQDAAPLVQRLRHCFDAYLTGTFVHEELVPIRLEAIQKHGLAVPVELSVAPMRTTQGLVLRVGVRDVSERQRLQHEADRMKDGFLATVSHELRTPLTSVLGYGELLADLGPQDVSLQARAFIEIINRNARRELRLVDDLLTMVQIGEGGLGIRLDYVDLSKVVHDAVEGATPVARRAHVLLSLADDCDGVHVLGDADRLGEATDNLISNAIKFSPGGAEVVIDLRAEPETVSVSVSDTGLGIPEADLDHVFEPLYRGENAVAAEKPGAGLGLSIVRSIVEAHRGTISVACTGTTTTFEMTLPLARERPLEAVAAR